MSWQHPWKLQAKASLIIILIVGGAILVTELLHQYYVAELAKDVIHSKSLVLLRQIGARFQSEKQFQNAHSCFWKWRYRFTSESGGI